MRSDRRIDGLPGSARLYASAGRRERGLGGVVVGRHRSRRCRDYCLPWWSSTSSPPWVWRLAGRGVSVRGELRIREHELRFVPSAYWRARGANEVLGTIESAVHEQRWSLYTLSDEVCLVRRAYR